MLDDSLTSLQWLQNLNILKPAETGSLDVAAVVAASESLDLDSAAVPAATNNVCREKEEVVETKRAGNSKSDKKLVGYQTQCSLPANLGSGKAAKREVKGGRQNNKQTALKNCKMYVVIFVDKLESITNYFS